jgi:hypothetical protein
MVSTPEEVAAAWKANQEFAGKIGGKVTVLPDINGAKVFQAETFGTWNVIYLRDREIGGVYEADDVQKAREFLQKQIGGGQ